MFSNKDQVQLDPDFERAIAIMIAMKTNPKRSVTDFCFTIGSRSCSRNRSAIFLLQSDRD